MIPDMQTNTVSGNKSHPKSLARKLPNIT